MKIGIFTIIYNDKPLDKTLEYLSALGYEAVELACWKGSKHIDIDEITSGKAGELRRILNNYGMHISALNNRLESRLILGMYDESSKNSVEYGINRMKKTIDAAQSLNVPVVCAFAEVQEWKKYSTSHSTNNGVLENIFKTFKERWLPILDYAKDHGVKIAFETHPMGLNYNLETSKRLIENAEEHRALGFNYDPSHLVLQKIDP
ncbi:MAG: sugar phosphate isomerase/epimerase, partial [Nitrososphaerota archaeon]|nr:sugar phosphate isomerase/epimerase [Nitrososphaerota archaeon]